MLNHINLVVSDLKRSKGFFLAALSPLGYKVISDGPESVSFGQGGLDSQDFWIRGGTVTDKKSFYCLAFTAGSKKAVDDFYSAALKAGGKTHVAPGYRTEYWEGYYAAYVYDLDGYNIEAVFDDLSKLNK